MALAATILTDGALDDLRQNIEPLPGVHTREQRLKLISGTPRILKAHFGALQIAEELARHRNPVVAELHGVEVLDVSTRHGGVVIVVAKAEDQRVRVDALHNAFDVAIEAHFRTTRRE